MPITHTHTHTHTRLTALSQRLPRWAGTRKVKPIWILLKQETVSGCGNSWAMCKSAPGSRQITMPAPHHSVFYRPDALPAAQPTVSKHWRHIICADHLNQYGIAKSCAFFLDHSVYITHKTVLKNIWQQVNETNTTQPPFYRHYRGQPALAGTSSYELEDFVGAKFYCPHALASVTATMHSD